MSRSLGDCDERSRLRQLAGIEHLVLDHVLPSIPAVRGRVHLTLTIPDQWKIPAVIIMERTDTDTLLDFSNIPTQLDPGVLFIREAEHLFLCHAPDQEIVEHYPIALILVLRRHWRERDLVLG
jgi:hypothetical protein